MTCAWNLGCRREPARVGDQEKDLFLEIGFQWNWVWIWTRGRPYLGLGLKISALDLIGYG